MRRCGKENTLRKNFLKRWKNKILKGITAISAISFVVAGSALDSENFVIPSVIVLMSATWITLFSVANGGGKE